MDGHAEIERSHGKRDSAKLPRAGASQLEQTDYG